MSARTAPGGAAGATSATSAPREPHLPVSEAPVEELVARAAEGTQAAWDEIVRRYERLVWSVARSYRLSSADAGDAVQTTWLRLVEHLGKVRDPERLGAWLATTARRESLRIATHRRRQRDDGSDDDLALMPDTSVDVEESLLSSERDVTLLHAVRQLDDRCQKLLRVLSASPPPRYDAVAEAFGMPIGSIGPTRGRCLNRLKDVLHTMGYVPEAMGGL